MPDDFKECVSVLKECFQLSKSTQDTPPEPTPKTRTSDDQRNNITPPQSRALLEYLLKDPVSNAVGFKSRWSSLSSDEEFSLEENETTYADDVAKTKIVKDPDEKIENKDKQENMVLFTDESQKSLPEFHNSKYLFEDEKKEEVHVTYFDGKIHVNDRMTIEIQYRLQTGKIGWAFMVEWVKWQTNGANRNSNFYMKNKLLTIKCKDSILSGQEASNYYLQRHRVEQYQKKWRIVAQTGYLQDDTWTSLFNDELKISAKIQTIASELKSRKLKWLKSIDKHWKENLQQMCILTGTEWILHKDFSDEHRNPYLIQTVMNLENFVEKDENFREFGEMAQKESPKMACRQSCESELPDICDGTCRHNEGHQGEFHMCSGCYAWWTQMTPKNQGHHDGNEGGYEELD